MIKNNNSYKEKKQIFFLMITAILVGVLTSKIHSVALLWGPAIVLLGLYLTMKTRNRYGVAHLFAGYIMASEVYFRMTWAGLPWGFSKYGVILLLLFALIVDKRERKLPMLMFLFLLLLLPGIIGTFEYYDDSFTIKKSIIFNLLGPFVLVVSTFYFYQMKFTMKEFINLSRVIVLGVLTMSTLVYFNVGDYTAVKFTYSSNAVSSGGFSGNEVVIIFGLGILVLSLNIILKNKLFIYKFIDMTLLIIFLFQAFMTFSRGGLFSALVALFLGMLVYYISNKNLFIEFLKKTLFKIIIIILIGISIFSVVNGITGNKLYSRYFNINNSGKQLKKDYSTGRDAIVKGDLQLFRESDFVGVGVGVSKMERPNHKNFAAHVEYSRLLAEHGILGLIVIVILFLMPMKEFIRRLNFPVNNMILVSFSSLSLMTMTHAATRLSMVGFFFGLAFIFISKENLDA